jgi:hypothetical protein
MRMKRVFLSLRLAFEAIVGVLLLGNAVLRLSEYFTHRGLGPTVGTLIGMAVGIPLVWDAMRLRGLLNKADAQSESIL